MVTSSESSEGLCLPTYNSAALLAVDFSRWSLNEIAVRVALSLQGEALRMLEDLQPGEQADCPKLQHALKCRFGAENRQEATCEELVTLVRRTDEKLSIGPAVPSLPQLSKAGGQHA